MVPYVHMNKKKEQFYRFPLSHMVPSDVMSPIIAQRLMQSRAKQAMTLIHLSLSTFVFMYKAYSFNSLGPVG